MNEMEKISLSKPFLDMRETYAIEDVMESGCCAGTCEEVRIFEKEFAEFVGSKYAVATSSCTTALHLACLALDVNSKSKVVVPSYTFPATAFAPMYCGCNPAIVDVDPETYNIDTHIIPRNSDVIIPVHAFGNPACMGHIMDIAEEYDVKVIEDAACALPAYTNGKHAGTIADVGCYSFYAIKNLCTGEGGMLVTDNEEIAEKARSLCDFGKTTSKPLPSFTQLGYNYRLSGIQAAMGRIQLKKLPQMHKMRMGIANQYNKFIDSELSELVQYQEVFERDVSAYQRYAIVLGLSICRDSVMQQLAEKGIQTAIGTYDLTSQPVFNSQHINPNSALLFHQSLSLPMYPGLTGKEVTRVCEALKEVLKK